ncbi:MAG: hypothetical protein WCK84_02110 [Bacteroidota bacterium]
MAIRRSFEISMSIKGLSQKTLFAILSAILLLGVFVSVNYYFACQVKNQIPDFSSGVEREKLPFDLEAKGERLAFHDFELGNVNDTSSHMVLGGHTGKQSLKMSSKVPFSPGLWIKFKELYSNVSPIIKPLDSAWIRATGYVWFSCRPSEAKCSLVATCNHNGINFKYMFVALETENMKPNQWNKVNIDYHIPPAPDCEDILQVYFWYRGNSELLVDDVEVTLFTPGNEKINAK